MELVDLAHVKALFQGKTVCVVGCGPSALENKPGKIDSYDVVVRIKNFVRGTPETGNRMDVHYSFYGPKWYGPGPDALEGIKLHMCKQPNSMPFVSQWHKKRGKHMAYDYRYIYREREGTWVAPVYVPTDSEFMDIFDMLGKRQPTCGFNAIWLIANSDPKEIYLTGFDFGRSKKHIVPGGELEDYEPQKPTDPLWHDLVFEEEILKGLRRKVFITYDRTLHEIWTA